MHDGPERTCCGPREDRLGLLSAGCMEISMVRIQLLMVTLTYIEGNAMPSNAQSIFETIYWFI